jgi:hypothetical protein
MLEGEEKHLKQVLYKNRTLPAYGDEKKARINLTPTWFG